MMFVRSELQEGHRFEGNEFVSNQWISHNIKTQYSSWTFIEVDSTAVEVEHDERWSWKVFFWCFVSNCPNITWGFLREDGTATASLTSMLVRKRRDLESPGLEKQRYEVETLNGQWIFLELVLSCLGCLVCVCVCHVKLFFEYSWFEHLNMQYSYSHTCSVVFANFCPSPSSTSLSSNCYCKCVFKFK